MTKPKPSRSEQTTCTLFRDIKDRAAASAPKGKETMAGPGLNLLVLVPAAYRRRGKGGSQTRLSAGCCLDLMVLVRPAGPVRGPSEAKYRL